MLADLLRDTEPSLALLRRRSLVASADRSTLDAWSSRLTSLLSGPIAMRCAACALLSETVRQCAQPDFSRYREIWTAVLLKLLQPPAASSGGSSSGNSNLATHTAVRLAAAETLVVMVSTAARWPADRRELASHVSRLASTLVAMVDEPACQHGAVLALVRLCSAAPHSLRTHRERLGEALATMVLEAPTAAAAAKIEFDLTKKQQVLLPLYITNSY